MKTILVATDFSPAALNAVNYAADMAMAIDAELFLLNTFQIPVVYSEVPLAMNLDAMQKDAENSLKEVRDQLLQKRKGDLKIDTGVRVGNFFPELKAVCERINPYVVVMGSQGTTAAERILFGGHTVHAMQHLKYPLITVPPSATFSNIKKVCLAFDFEKIMDTVPIEEIKMLIGDFNAELHVLNVGKEEKYDSETVFAATIFRNKLAPVKLNYHFMSDEDTDNSIIEYAEKNKVDLLIVLPRRHGLLEKIIHKSHTKQFVLHSHIPVLALHHH